LLLIYLYIVPGFVKFSIASNIINVLNEDLMADIISSIAQQAVERTDRRLSKGDIREALRG